MSQLNHLHFKTNIIIPNSDSERLDYFLDISKSSRKDLRYQYSFPNLSKSTLHLHYLLYVFVIMHNSKYDSHCSTILLLKPQTSLESVKTFSKSFDLLFFQSIWKETPPKRGTVFSGHCVGCFEHYITKVIHHPYTCFPQISIELIVIQSPTHGVRV